ncbi:MAG: hypothetical protein C4291_05690 [Candidatus Dadabacteria bacterium]
MKYSVLNYIVVGYSRNQVRIKLSLLKKFSLLFLTDFLKQKPFQGCCQNLSDNLGFDPLLLSIAEVYR